MNDHAAGVTRNAGRRRCFRRVAVVVVMRGLLLLLLLLHHPVERDRGGEAPAAKAVGEDEPGARVVRRLPGPQPPDVRQVLRQGGEAPAQGLRGLDG